MTARAVSAPRCRFRRLKCKSRAPFHVKRDDGCGRRRAQGSTDAASTDGAAEVSRLAFHVKRTESSRRPRERGDDAAARNARGATTATVCTRPPLDTCARRGPRPGRCRSLRRVSPMGAGRSTCAAARGLGPAARGPRCHGREIRAPASGVSRLRSRRGIARRPRPSRRTRSPIRPSRAERRRVWRRSSSSWQPNRRPSRRCASRSGASTSTSPTRSSPRDRGGSRCKNALPISGLGAGSRAWSSRSRCPHDASRSSRASGGSARSSSARRRARARQRDRRQRARGGLAGGLGVHDVVTARALAPLGVLVEYAAPLLRDGGSLVAWKGRRDPPRRPTPPSPRPRWGWRRPSRRP